MGSDCSPLHQERSRTMRLRCLAFLLLVSVAGVQLLEDEPAESALNKLRESEVGQSLADVVLPLVKRETQEKKKGTSKIRKKKRSKKVGKNQNRNGGQKRTKGGKKK